MKIVGVGIMMSALVVASCRQPNDSAKVQDAVLSPGQTVEATNKNGGIRISYQGPTGRKYEWDEQQKVLKLKVRPEPFQGKLGLYDPADSWLFSGGTRLVVEEAVRDFENEEQMNAALVESNDYMDWVYTNDGLVVGFGRTPARRQVDVDLWQFLLRGRKPTNLPGARPDRIGLKTSY